MTSPAPTNNDIFASIVDRINMGVLVVDINNTVILWNRFMANHSDLAAAAVVGKSLFDTFPSLPRTWLAQKIRNVFTLKNFSFTTWENRQFLFPFKHNYPITGDTQNMRQNCTFIPIKNATGDVEFVCIALTDVTETSMFEAMLKDAVRSLEELSSRDALTGIFNRRHLEIALSKEFSRAKRYGAELTVIIMDIDFFKKINDTLGHKIGDSVIKTVAQVLSDTVRESDICGRYGGEEFLVILPETDIKGATILAERLRATFEETPATADGKAIPFTASIGVAHASDATVDHEQLVHNADLALYYSKQNGRNCVTIYEKEGFQQIERSPKSVKSARRVVFHVKIGHK